ncbi:uncharacterized protein AMSG_04846 [Thecamonas trahens ATCC 50062]|uniref:FYVE-type domain-containing protein n=1 Tax=Thecamonas trahens ATCC 50062 TaxID=461836 RepID=A0A0L0D7N0_THETB|nr:hypothetical protein AMSG_04846 [Thecamonas trahens ATCC 50062]KNC48397.1 hypothetical protein AMSG_04846 [Thecamonas trahens ATCC 50062]|eukprot:XP_013758514.1 hypothetical protein AMSG_04846 [Thecamonas trahens ATCC 50062]
MAAPGGRSGAGRRGVVDVTPGLTGPEALRPVWVDDKQASECFKCGLLFSLFRWKHHCRQCGAVFCNSCSNKRIPLPHLGYHEPVRICLDCIQLAYLVSCTASNNPTVASHGAVGLAQLSADPALHERLLRAAALPALVALVDAGAPALKVHATGAIANLAQVPDMHSHLLRTGVLAPLLGVLRGGLSQLSPQLVHNVLGAASNLALGAPARAPLVDAGCIPLLTDALFVPDQELASLALRTACALAADPPLARMFIQDDSGVTFRRILSLITSVAPKPLLKLLAKFLAHVSLVDDALKVRMLELGTLPPLQALALVRSKGIVTLAVCALANLASVDDNREFVGSAQGLKLLWRLLLRGKSTDIVRHASRALANLALNDTVKLRMLHSSAQLFPRLLQLLSLTPHPDVVLNTLRIMANLALLPLGAVLLTQSGPQPLLLEHSTSDDEAVRSCASFALSRLIPPTTTPDSAPELAAAFAAAASIRSASRRRKTSLNREPADSASVSSSSLPQAGSSSLASPTASPAVPGGTTPRSVPHITKYDLAALEGPADSSPESVASSHTSSTVSSLTSNSTLFSDSDPFALPRASPRRRARPRHRSPGYVGVTLSARSATPTFTPILPTLDTRKTGTSLGTSDSPTASGGHSPLPPLPSPASTTSTDRSRKAAGRPGPAPSSVTPPIPRVARHPVIAPV